LKKNENSHEKKMGQIDTVFRKTVEGMKLQDLIHIKKLGEGQFGEVFLCYSKKTNTYYALKCISREKIAQFKSCIYFLLSYCQGLELFDAIR
jgi:cGMP-dependent protein kinase